MLPFNQHIYIKKSVLLLLRSFNKERFIFETPKRIPDDTIKKYYDTCRLIDNNNFNTCDDRKTKIGHNIFKDTYTHKMYNFED